MTTDELAQAAIRLLSAERTTIATAESLTGGLVAAALTSVPGASKVFAGGIIAYSAELKAKLLGVPTGLAVAMARGARQRLGSKIAVATTGVAGPDPVGDLPPGIVYVAVSFAERELHLALTLEGDRAQIRHDTVRHVLGLLVSAFQPESAEDN